MSSRILNNMVKIAPSILSGNFLNLEPDIRMVNGNADLIHIDVMDGSLVPNISFGFPVMEAIAKAVTVLNKANARKFDGNEYVCVVHPSVAYDRRLLVDVDGHLCCPLVACGRYGRSRGYGVRDRRTCPRRICVPCSKPVLESRECI